MRLLLLNYGKYIGELVVTIDLAPTTIFTFHLVNLPETLVLHLIVNPAVHGIIILGFPKPIQLRQMDPNGTNWVCLKIYRNPVVYLFFSFEKKPCFFSFLEVIHLGQAPLSMVFLVSSTLWCLVIQDGAETSARSLWRPRDPRGDENASDIGKTTPKNGARVGWKESGRLGISAPQIFGIQQGEWRFEHPTWSNMAISSSMFKRAGSKNRHVWSNKHVVKPDDACIVSKIVWKGYVLYIHHWCCWNHSNRFKRRNAEMPLAVALVHHAINIYIYIFDYIINTHIYIYDLKT